MTVRNEVLWTRHDFLRPPADDLGFRNTKDLVKADMTPMQKPSLMTSSVSGPQQKAPYFSPNVEGTGLPIADMAMMRVLGGCGHWHKADEAWKGCFVDVDHQFVFRFLWDVRHLTMASQQVGCLHCTITRTHHALCGLCSLWSCQGVVGYQEVKFAKLNGPQLAHMYN